VDLGGGGEGRARVESAATLFDCDGGTEAFDRIDIGFFQLIKKLACVGRERLHIAALSLRVERVEGERGLAGSTGAGDDHEFAFRNIDIDVPQVVLSCAADPDRFHVCSKSDTDIFCTQIPKKEPRKSRNITK